MQTNAVRMKSSFFLDINEVLFSRSFDSVSHTKLLARLHSYGIRGDVLKWLQNFLKNRTHQTRVGQCLSVIANLLSGVVQGSEWYRATFVSSIH